MHADGDLTLYDPDVDVSMSLYYPMIDEGAPAPDIGAGIYFGGYFSRQSRFFTDYFNSRRIYTMLEAGLAINPIENEDVPFITIPFRADFGYRIGIGKSIALIPFIGVGFQITYNDYLSDPSYNAIFEDRAFFGGLVETGLEFRWEFMARSTLRLRLNYGIVFDGRVESGYIPYLLIRFPVPFIP
jgi:hypothetical protein